MGSTRNLKAEQRKRRVRNCEMQGSIKEADNRKKILPGRRL